MSPEDSRQSIEAFTADGRMPREQLYSAYDELLVAGWERDIIATQYQYDDAGAVRASYPIYVYTSHPHLPRPVDSFYLLATTHGDEPAPAQAAAEQVPTLVEFADSGTPVVFSPLLSPLGYTYNFHFPNGTEDYRLQQSVTDSDHLLPHPDDPTKPCFSQPTSQVAAEVTAWFLQQSMRYRPMLVLDLHEDKYDINGVFHYGNHMMQQFETYLYFAGDPRYLPLAHQVVRILAEADLPVTQTEETRFGQPIDGGVVVNPRDGSLEQLLASPVYFDHGMWRPKFAAPAVITAETGFYPDGRIPLVKRVRGHEMIIAASRSLWEEAQRLRDSR